MRAGQRRHRVLIQKKKKAKNTSGEQTYTWIDEDTEFVAIYPLRGEEYFNAQQIQAGVSHKIVMRYKTLQDETRITPNCRIKKIDDSRIFNIRQVVDVGERKKSLEILCDEEV